MGQNWPANERRFGHLPVHGTDQAKVSYVPYLESYFLVFLCHSRVLKGRMPVLILGCSCLGNERPLFVQIMPMPKEGGAF